MRWQKIARFAIALFVIGFAIVVFLAMRPRPVPSGNDTGVQRADPKAIYESGAGERKSFDFGKLSSILKYERLLSLRRRPIGNARRHADPARPQRT